MKRIPGNNFIAESVKAVFIILIVSLNLHCPIDFNYEGEYHDEYITAGDNTGGGITDDSTLLDSTFGTGGIVNYSLNASIRGIALQNDSKIVLSCTNTTSNTNYLVRFNTDGTLDSSYGSADKTVSISGNLFIQPDNNVIIAGGIVEISAYRYDTNGIPDTSFNMGAFDYFSCIKTMQYDGKLLLAGVELIPAVPMVSDQSYNAIVARYNTDGTIDTSFDTDGVTTAVTSGSGNQISPVAIKTNGGSNYLICTKTPITGSAPTSYLAVKLLSNGSLDTTFNGTGILTLNINITEYPYFQDFNIQPDGKLVIIYNGTASETAIAIRYNTDGSQDTTFLASNIGHVDKSCILSDGRMLLLGSGGIIRLNYDGTKDSTFGGDGRIFIYGTGLGGFIIGSDNKIISYYNTTDQNGNTIISLLRFNPQP